MGREEAWGLDGVAEDVNRSGEITWVVEWVNCRLHWTVRWENRYSNRSRMGCARNMRRYPWLLGYVQRWYKEGGQWLNMFLVRLELEINARKFRTTLFELGTCLQLWNPNHCCRVRE